MHGSEGSGSGSLLLVGGGGVSFRFREDSALRDEDDVFVRELLLEFSGEPVVVRGQWMSSQDAQP